MRLQKLNFSTLGLLVHLSTITYNTYTLIMYQRLFFPKLTFKIKNQDVEALVINIKIAIIPLNLSVYISSIRKSTLAPVFLLLDSSESSI